MLFLNLTLYIKGDVKNSVDVVTHLPLKFDI